MALTWTDNATAETKFAVQRSSDNGATWTTIASPAARTGTGSVTYTDTTVSMGTTYVYRVAAATATDQSDWSNAVTVKVDVPAAPVIASATAARSGSNERLTVTWTAVPGATGYTVQWSASSTFASIAGSGTTTGTTFTSGNVARQTWYVRVVATNVLGGSAPSAVRTVAPA